MADIRPIDANALFDALRDNEFQTLCPLDEVDDVIAAAPTLDYAPVRHGEWLLRHVGHGHYWECSECHTNPCIYVTEDTKFCPNCGTKMDGGKENV